MSVITPDIADHWAAIEPLLTIRNEAEYERAVERMHALLDEVGTNEQHPLYELLDTLGTLLHAYEEAYHTLPESTRAEILHYLMEEHDLKQSDLSEIGSQGVISEVLNGKRALNVRQIRLLAERFGVSPAVFF